MGDLRRAGTHFPPYRPVPSVAQRNLSPKGDPCKPWEPSTSGGVAASTSFPQGSRGPSRGCGIPLHAAKSSDDALAALQEDTEGPSGMLSPQDMQLRMSLARAGSRDEAPGLAQRSRRPTLSETCFTTLLPAARACSEFGRELGRCGVQLYRKATSAESEEKLVPLVGVRLTSPHLTSPHLTSPAPDLTPAPPPPPPLRCSLSSRSFLA